MSFLRRSANEAVKNQCDFLEGEAAEEMKLDDARLPQVEPGESLEGLVKDHNVMFRSDDGRTASSSVTWRWIPPRLPA